MNGSRLRASESAEGLERPTWQLGVLVGLAAVSGGLLLAFGGPLAGLAAVLALLAGYVVLRELEYGFWGIIAVVCLLPFATIPVDVGVTPTLLDVALAATAGVWLLQLVTGRRRKVQSAPVVLPLVGFLLGVIFAFTFGLANGPLTANLLRHFAELLLSIGFVVIVVDFFASSERIERAVRVLILLGTAAAGIAIFLWLMPDATANSLLNALQRLGYPGGMVIRYIEENPELAERAIGTSVDPNALGGLLLMIGALAGPQLLAKRPLFDRRVVVACFLIVAVALVLTFSRGAMVGLAAGLVYVAIVRYRRLIIYLAVALVVFLLLPFTQSYVARFLEGLQGQDLATQMRFGEYRDALTLIGRYPLFGVGFAGSPDIDLYLGVANVYLTIAQQMGIFGLLGFGAVMAFVFGDAYFQRNRLKGNERLDPLWLGLHAALFGGLVSGIFDHYLFNINFHHAVTIFWLLVGLATAATRAGVTQAQKEKSGNPWWGPASTRLALD